MEEQKLRVDRNIGDNLKRLRTEYGISQEKLCARLQLCGCDIGRTTYAKYEAGELNIRISVLAALKKIYGCSYDDFFTEYKDGAGRLLFLPMYSKKSMIFQK